MSTNPFHTPPVSRDGGLLPPPVNRESVWVRLNLARRYAVNHIITGLAVLSTVLVILPLVAILVYLI